MIREIQILLVEDNPGDARLIRELLRSKPSERLVINHVETLTAAMTRATECHVVLLDLSLPDSFGLDTLVKMRAQTPDTAIVVLTGTEDEDLGLQALQLGAQDYLPKGDLEGKLLLRSIQYAIERHRGELAVRRSEQAYRSLIDDVFDTSMVAVIILDRAFRVVWCNEATEVYFGIKRETIIGRDKRRLIDEELKCVFADPDDYATRLLRAYDGGVYTERFECNVVAAEGRQDRWLEHWSQPIRSGMYAGGRIEQYNDITTRKLLEIAEREQRDFSEAMREIATLLTSTLDLKDVLERILNNLGRVLMHDSASITILEDDYIWIARHRTIRDTQEIVAERQLQTEYRHYLTRIIDTRQPVVVADLQEDEQVRETAIQASVRAYVGVPIMLQDEIIGFVNAFNEKPNTFDIQDSERVLAFAELAAIAIQNARLFQKSQELAAVEVRQRLARELHDSVTQTLYTTQNMAESALRRWQRDPERAHNLMQSVYQLTRTALAEMRILLLELRPSALSQVNLKTLFDQYLQPIVDRGQFNLQMSIDDVPPLPPDVQIALYRITQEALNNIDKHALAQHVTVTVRNHDDHVELQIRDDGRGFDVEEVASTSLGLNIMRERSVEINADINIRSEAGSGTQITVIWKKEKQHD